MKDQTQERWFQLCGLASIEQNPAKILALVTEINILLARQEPGRSRSEIQEWKSENISA
jgi:hypothetical protein